MVLWGNIGGYRAGTGVMWGYRDNGKENGNYYIVMVTMVQA